MGTPVLNMIEIGLLLSLVGALIRVRFYLMYQSAPVRFKGIILLLYSSQAAANAGGASGLSPDDLHHFTNWITAGLQPRSLSNLG